MTDILVISDDVVGRRMAGPGIRAWELSRVLAGRFAVELAIPDYSPEGLPEGGSAFKTWTYSLRRPKPVEEAARRARIVILQGYILSKFPGLAAAPGRLVADIYDPFVLENLFIHAGRPDKDRDAIHAHDLRVANRLLLTADHFLCASERQKDLFIGALMSLNRIDPAFADGGPDIDRLISVVPFGIDGGGTAEAGGGESLDLCPGLGRDDILLLWGGVLTPWYDPYSLLEALAVARRSDPRLKLLFLSTGHPNPAIPRWTTGDETRRLVDANPLLRGAVYFNDGWIPYQERGRYFRRADIGVSIHKTHFETRYAFRTRMLDYIKHGCPILCSEGDYFADLTAREGLGVVVGSGDREAIARGILELAGNPGLRAEIRSRMEKIRPRFQWSEAAAPLLAWCKDVPPALPEAAGAERAERIRKAKVTGGRRLGHNKAVETARRMLRPAGGRPPSRLVVRLRRLLGR